MPTLPDFRLETFFTKWEFVARHHLTASDAQTHSVSELVALADEIDRKAWEMLRLGYTDTYGAPDLRAAIAATYETAGADEVVCCAGPEEAIYLAMHVLLDPGDHAVVITPNYQSAETVPLSICEVTGVALRPETGWALDLDDLRHAIRPNTKVVSVNFPHNPTGAVPDRQTFEELVSLCESRGMSLFSDEVYRGVETDPGRTLPQAADLAATALSLNGMSKAYGLPGLRIGWITSHDQALLDRIVRAKHYTSICNSAPGELLALIALKARDHILARNRKIIIENTPVFDAFFAEFDDLFTWAPPQGGCVCYPRYHGADGVEAMCRALVEQVGVLLLPASIYRSDLTDTPHDRFRIGLGRRDPQPALDAFAHWLRQRR